MENEEQIKTTVRVYWVFVSTEREMRCVLALPGENCFDAVNAAHPGIVESMAPKDEKPLLYLSDLSMKGKGVFRMACLFVRGSDMRRRLVNRICWRVMKFGFRNKETRMH